MYGKTDYLVHYGTPGMRWGQRKKILESISSGSEAGKRIANLTEKVSKKKKDLSKMSDEELAKALGRSVGAVKAKMRQLKLKSNND